MISDAEKLKSYDQIKREHDLAISQLKSLGYSLGEKPRSGDCISRKSMLIKVKKYFSDLSYTKEMLYKDLDALPSLDMAQWIPCAEKLPENDESVLITHSQGVTKAWWNGRIWMNGLTKKFKTVIAWMPLPKAYEVK